MYEKQTKTIDEEKTFNSFGLIVILLIIAIFLNKAIGTSNQVQTIEPIVTIGAFTNFLDTIIGDEFVITDGVLTSVDETLGGMNKIVPEGVLEIAPNSFNNPFKAFSEVETIEFPNTVTTLQDNALYKCENLISVIIPESVIYIGEDLINDRVSPTFYVKENSYAYEFCVENDYIFEIYTYETKPNFKGYTLHQTNPEFYVDGEILVGYNAPNSYTTTVTVPTDITIIGTEAFYRPQDTYTSLTELTTNSLLTGVDQGIVTINLPDTITHIQERGFRNLSKMKKIDLPNSIIEIGDYAFIGCKSLTEIKIPNSATTIGESIFIGCDNLQKIYIPSSVTLIKGKILDNNHVVFKNDHYNLSETPTSLDTPTEITATIYVQKDSYAESYCIKNGWNFDYY